VKERLQVEIFGHRYTLTGESNDADYVRSLAAYVDQKMKEVARQTQGMPQSKLAILAAINITHEFFQAKNHQKERETFLDGKTRDLIESIEDQFEDFKLE